MVLPELTHPGNILISVVESRIDPDASPEWIFKFGNLGMSKLEQDIDPVNTVMAGWMLPPESLDPASFGLIDRCVDIYHAGLVLLSVLLGETPQFSHPDILAGKPRGMAERLRSPFGPVIARSLRRHVGNRTQSAIEFWREVKAESG